MPHIASRISVDIILPITRYNRLIKLMQDAKQNPKWLRHRFIIILNGLTQEDIEKSRRWLTENMSVAAPEYILDDKLNGLRKKTSELFDYCTKMLTSEYVYMLVEDDELPINLDRAIYEMYHDEDTDILVAKCETFLNDKTPVEVFPPTKDDEFLYDCEEAMKLFPSYADPCSALIRTSVFKTEEYYKADMPLQEFANSYFMIRCLNNENIKVDFAPYTLRIAVREKTSAVEIKPALRQKLVEDIKLWLPSLPEDKYKEFQADILETLSRGEITTFKEIDARIEDYLDKAK